MSILDQYETIAIEDLVSNALPAGEKVIEITGITSGASKNKKTPYVRFAYRVVESNNPTDVGKEGRFDRYLSVNAIRILGRDLINAGIRGAHLPKYRGEGDPEELAAAVADMLSPMVSRRFQANFLKQKDDRGIDRNEVQLSKALDPVDLGHASSSY